MTTTAIPRMGLIPRSPFDAPPADGRTPNNPDVPGRFRSPVALRLLWCDRDSLYAQSSRALTDQQIEAIREFRKKEVNDLSPDDRARAWALAHSWYPPQHGQGAIVR